MPACDSYFANIPSAFANLSSMEPPIVNPRHSLIEYEFTWIFSEMAVSQAHAGGPNRCLEGAPAGISHRPHPFRSSTVVVYLDCVFLCRDNGIRCQ
jgi:hypothetical protein